MFLNTFLHYRNVSCGLVYYLYPDPNLPVHVELTSVDVQATVVHCAAEVFVTQKYINNCKEPIDTVFIFPIHNDDVVTGFEAETEQGVITHLITSEAGPECRLAYAAAVKKHPKRFHLGEDEPRDVYQTRVGRLEAGASVVITIAYTTELRLVIDRFQLTICNTVVPRFKKLLQTEDQNEKSAEDQAEDNIVCIDLEDDHQPAQSKKTEDEPILPRVPAKVKILVEFLLQGPSSIQLMQCDSHDPSLAFIDQLADRENWTTAKLQVEGTEDDMDRDFNVAITPADIVGPKIYVEESLAETLVMTSFCPVFASSDTSDSEFVLAVDAGLDEPTTIKMQETILFLLKSLRSGSSFNMIGPSLKFLFSQPQSCESKENVRKANHFVTSECAFSENSVPIQSTFAVLEKVYKSIDATEGMTQTQLLMIVQRTLTLEDYDLCESLVKHHTKSHKTRLFVIGIGSGISFPQICDLAYVGEGTASQIPVTEDLTFWQPVVTELMNLANSPSLTDLKLTWSEWEDRRVSKPVQPVIDLEAEDDGIEILSESAGMADRQAWVQVPEIPTTVFSGTQLMTCGIFVNKCYPRKLEVQGWSYGSKNGHEEFKYEINLQESREYYTGSVDVIRKLAYAKALKQLEDAIPKQTGQSRRARSDVEKMKDKILKIATQEGIPSKYSHFTTIDLESGAEVKGHWTRQTTFAENVVAVGTPTSLDGRWRSNIPYGSIPRNKLSSIRKMSVGEVPSKMARADAYGDEDWIDLTQD